MSGFLAALCVLLGACLAGCGGGTDGATINSSTAADTTHPRGATAILSGVHENGLTGKIVMPGFPYGDEVNINAKGVGQAQGDREYAVWGKQGKTMILLGTWPAGPNGNLKVHDDLSISKLLILVQQGTTDFLISRGNIDRVFASIGHLDAYVRPDYIGTEVLEGPMTGPGVDSAQG